MAKMISSESTSAGQLSKATTKLNKQVSRFLYTNSVQGSMLDRKKIGADLRTSEDQPNFKFAAKETGKKPAAGTSSMLSLVGTLQQPAVKKAPTIFFGLKKTTSHS